MAEDRTPPDPKPGPAPDRNAREMRERRRAEALRENLRRRKAPRETDD